MDFGQGSFLTPSNASTIKRRRSLLAANSLIPAGLLHRGIVRMQSRCLPLPILNLPVQLHRDSDENKLIIVTAGRRSKCI